MSVIDEPLDIDAAVIRELRDFREKPKLEDLPGLDPEDERARLTAVLDDLTDALIEGVQANPNKLWVLQQFQRFLVKVQEEDTEGREHLGLEIEQVMDVLRIESSDGLLAFYLGGL